MGSLSGENPIFLWCESLDGLVQGRDRGADRAGLLKCHATLAPKAHYTYSISSPSALTDSGVLGAASPQQKRRREIKGEKRVSVLPGNF